MAEPISAKRSMRSVAVLEAAKGIVVLLAGGGLAAWLHPDAGRWSALIVMHFHLNPAKLHPQILLDALNELANVRLTVLAFLASLYSLVRLIEAYGLWRGRRWAAKLAAMSGGIYIPFELYELVLRPGALPMLALLINLIVVWAMLKALYGYSQR